MHLNRVAAGAATSLAVAFLAACSTDPTSVLPSGPSVRPTTSYSPNQPVPPLPSNLNQEGATCSESDGWTKINDDGTASGLWGSFSFGGATGSTSKTVTYSVNGGFTVQFCLKYSNQLDYRQIVGAATGTLSTDDVNGPDKGKDISHLAWRAFGSPTIPVANLTAQKTATASYDVRKSWTLTKKVNNLDEVSFTGGPGQTFNAQWQVTVGATSAEEDRSITGTITVTNPNAFAVPVNVADVLSKQGVNLATAVAVDCNPLVPGSQPSGSVPAKTGGVNGTLACAYTASPSNRDADLNTATVTVDASFQTPTGYTGTVNGDIATATITWTLDQTIDNSAELTDAYFALHGLTPSRTLPATLIEGTTVTASQTFSCSSNSADYTNNYTYSYTRTNVANLDLPVGTDLSADAVVNVTCALVWRGETATGDGLPWALTKRAPANWFEYTPWLDILNAGSAGVILYAGQTFEAGKIVASSTSPRELTITLNPGYRFANVINNVKVLPMASCSPANTITYVQPGQYSIKQSVTDQTQTSVVVSGLGTTALCYAIHIDVERLILP